VERIAVDLDDEPTVRPQEVDLISPGSCVGLRLGQARGSDQLEQSPLGFGAGEFRLGL
jgi:hypothetical protein